MSVMSFSSKTSVEFGEAVHKKSEAADLLVLNSGGTYTYVKNKDHALQLIKEPDTRVRRPIVPASPAERRSFFRYYVCAISKLQLNYMQPIYFKQTFWENIFKIVVERLPHTYIHLFLARYAPHEHFFCSKMGPLFWGFSLQVLLCGFFQLGLYSDMLITIINYIVNGFFKNSPWNRCDKETYNYREKTIHCYNLHTFNYITKDNVTHDLQDGSYQHLMNDTYFMPTQVLYFALYQEKVNKEKGLNNFLWVYHLLIWITALAFRNQVYKKIIWRAFNLLLWSMCLIYLLTIVYIEYAFYAESLKPVTITDTREMKDLQHANIEKIALYTTAPPVTHFLYARSNDDEMREGRESAILSISGCVYSIFQGITFARLRHYCESKAGIMVQLYPGNYYPLFYLYPMFFRSFALSPLYSKYFYINLFFLEYIIFIIIYQCMIDVTICEWPKMSGLMVSIIIAIAGIIYGRMTTIKVRTTCYALGSNLAVVMELIIICWFYPAQRLLEDIHFFNYGDRIKSFRLFIITILPIFNIFYMLNLNHIVGTYFNYVGYVYGVCMGPIIFGVFYMISWKIKKKLKWKYLLCPLPTWGPQEYVVRLFRKQFNSDTFIDSMSSRFLSRHMLKRAELPSYRLGVHYDYGTRRRSSGFPVNSRWAD